MKRWPTKPLGELLRVQNGFAFKSELFNEDGKGLPIIRIRDLVRGFSETFYDGEHDPAFEVENGDFLIGMDGEFRCYRWQGGRLCSINEFVVSGISAATLTLVTFSTASTTIFEKLRTSRRLSR